MASELTDRIEPSQDASGVETPAPSDVQRASLRELVKLAADCASTESHDQRWYQQSVDKSRQEYERAKSELEENHRRTHAETEQQYAQASETLSQQYTSAVRQLQESERSARSRADQDKAAVDRDAKAKYTQAAWLADSVLEATQNHIRDEYKQGIEQARRHVKQAESLAEQAAYLVASFGQAWPDLDSPPAPPAPERAGEAFTALEASATDSLHSLSNLRLPRLMNGVTYFMLTLVVMLLAAGGAQLAYQTREPQWEAMGAAAGGTMVACVVLGVWLSRKAKGQVIAAARSLRSHVEAVQVAAQTEQAFVEERRRTRTAEAQAKRDQEVKAARDHVQPIIDQATQGHQLAIDSIQAQGAARLPQLEEKRDKAAAEAKEWRTRTLAELEQHTAREREAMKQRLDAHLARVEEQHARHRTALTERWQNGLAAIESPYLRTAGGGSELVTWDADAWRAWTPPTQFPDAVRFGEFQVDLKQITEHYPRTLALPESFSVPALLSFPRHASLLLHADAAGRPQAIATLQTIMLRLLTSLPAGRVRFTIIDPVGLGQNFAGFMHLADYDEALVGSRIWTEPEHIQQRLADLTEHMETVIQKYLRNEFATIDEYNAQAGELAEPYRFLVIADLPAALTDESLHRLSSIATTGARCGVYTLVMRDTRATLNNRAVLDNLTASSINLIRENGRYVWKDEVFRKFPLALDPPPSEEFLTDVLHRVGRAAREAKRVEVPFRTIAPPDEKIWSGSTASEVSVPIGRMGATRLQTLRLGRGVAQHMLIAGKTGSGKSTLLHVLITNLALWYSPDEVEFYLVDFKKGVEFKAYATHNLPHARAIAVESDREFGLSVLQRVDAELARRGQLFRDAGVQDLAAYRQTPGAKVMPRTLLVIDEFQEFFSEDDRIAQDAGLLLDRLVRQGRAFGIHVLLGSQTIGGTSGLARSTLGQMAVRIALQTSEADSQLILGDNNLAARLLSRPGEAIYNDAGGLVEANSPFQISWLADEERERQLERVNARFNGDPAHPPAVVFEGNVPADIRRNPLLTRQLASRGAKDVVEAARLWIGEPVAIKEPTHIVLRRQSGSNALIVGQQEDSALALMGGALISLAAQHAGDGAKVYLLDGTPADSPLAGTFERLRGALPLEITLVDYRRVPETMGELAALLQERQESGEGKPPSCYLFIYGLQRYRPLRKSEDSFSFGSSSDAGPQPDRQFADLLRDGPPVGIHTVAWIDTVASLERTLDRGSMREFDNRILFQMSANDSSTLIDSPMGNKLGMNRGLSYSEEQGVVEKFRPYALPTMEWLREVFPSS